MWDCCLHDARLKAGARKGLCHGNHGCENLWGYAHWASFFIKADVWSGTNAQHVADSVEAREYWVTAHGVADHSTPSSKACFLCFVTGKTSRRFSTTDRSQQAWFFPPPLNYLQIYRKVRCWWFQTQVHMPACHWTWAEHYCTLKEIWPSGVEL